ncbi:MAG: hypothetical protein ACE5JJ_10990 [Nitrospinota bacterium]
MRGWLGVEAGFPPLSVEAELACEMAEALGRTGARLKEWWGEALALKELLAGARERGEEPPPDLLRAYREAQREARRWRYYLIVQREAIGFRHHAEVERRYPLEALGEPGRGAAARGV